MKRILLVDDDAMIREIYRQGFVQEGFLVETADDGLAAMKALHEAKPDIVVLDLMMPKFTGVDVLRFIRSQADLASTPVLLLTNTFMGDLPKAAVGLGVECAAIKSQCTPSKLAAIANQVLAGAAPGAAAAHHAATPKDWSVKARQSFLDNAPAAVALLRKLCDEFESSSSDARAVRLDSFYRKVHYVTAVAGMANCHVIALLSGALEALLFELHDKPAKINTSVLHTVATTMNLLEDLFDSARDQATDEPLGGHVLVVDDDPITNRAAVAALHRAHLRASSTENPLLALDLLQQFRFDLVLLDIEMPHLNGFDLCRRLRAIPGYATTPVIFVTNHSDFENRSQSVLSGGDDLIAKPVFPIEVAVKAVLYLLKGRLPARANVSQS